MLVAAVEQQLLRVQQDVLLQWVGGGLGSTLVPAVLLPGSSCCKCSCVV
jgi:hypothetical protein